MSSMENHIQKFLPKAAHYKITLLLTASALISPVAAYAQSPVAAASSANSAVPMSGGWNVPQNLRDVSEGNVPMALQRWKMLRSSPNYSFDEYARFLTTYPGWPDAKDMQKNAETASDIDNYPAETIAAFFDRYPPITNSGRAKYALALLSVGESTRAGEWGRKAWRGGPLSELDEARLLGAFGNIFTPDDHDMRMDALLSSGAANTAARQLEWTSPQRRAGFAAALANRNRAADADSQANFASSSAMNDPSFVGERARYLVRNGRASEARQLLANRPTLSRPPADAEDWLEILLTNARGAENDGRYSEAYEISSNIYDAVPAGTDLSKESLGVRDDFTSLAWMAGRLAFEKLNKPGEAVRHFAAYGDAAKTPQITSKGYYWAARAAGAAGDQASRTLYLEKAAEYPDYYYGMLALEALGRPMPALTRNTNALGGRNVADKDHRYMAARLAGSQYGWQDQTMFLRAIANDAETEQEFQDAMGLSLVLGRPDLSVMSGRNARLYGYTSLIPMAYPSVSMPGGYQSNFTLTHAIMRQESQFDSEAVSHAGARGMMQLMPGTAREVANGLGLGYNRSALNSDPLYNIKLGSTYIDKMLRYYDGNYVLAIAAYNAGPGNVNKWIRANGDPRNGSVDIITWVENIPIYETKNYVQRVLENLVMYDLLYPNDARRGSVRPMSSYLGL